MTDSADNRSSGEWLRAVITIAVLFLSSAGWLWGLFNSETLFFERHAAPPHRSTQHPAEPGDDSQLRRAAEAYWDRYPDIKEHHYFGVHGPLGIDGAREHYRQHGRHEGRIYGLPADTETLRPEKEHPRKGQ